MMLAMGSPPVHTLPVAEAQVRTMASLIAGGQPAAGRGVEDNAVPTPSGARVLRVYGPTAGDLPVALFLAGGGSTLDDVHTQDERCRRPGDVLGVATRFARLPVGPEHKHPVTVEDARMPVAPSTRLGGLAAI